MYQQLIIITMAYRYHLLCLMQLHTRRGLLCGHHYLVCLALSGGTFYLTRRDPQTFIPILYLINRKLQSMVF